MTENRGDTSKICNTLLLNNSEIDNKIPHETLIEAFDPQRRDMFMFECEILVETQQKNVLNKL